jgi:hypothetical protein
MEPLSRRALVVKLGALGTSLWDRFDLVTCEVYQLLRG